MKSAKAEEATDLSSAPEHDDSATIIVVEVNSFNLGKTLGHKAGFLTTVRFDVEDPSVFNNLTAFRPVDQVIDFASFECL